MELCDRVVDTTTTGDARIGFALKEAVMRRGSVLKIAAVGLVGLVGASAATFGGYRAVTGKCLLTGACESKAQTQAVVTPVAASTGQEEACPMGCSESKDAKVETVALATETECQEKSAACAEMVAECSEKLASECTEKLADACATAGADCADDCNAETCDKPDCCKKVAQNTATEKVGG